MKRLRNSVRALHPLFALEHLSKQEMTKPVLEAVDLISKLPAYGRRGSIPLTPADFFTAREAAHSVRAYEERVLKENLDSFAFGMVTAILSLQERAEEARREPSLSSDIQNFKDQLDTLSYDYMVPKAQTLEILGHLKDEITLRLKYVRSQKRKTFRFPEAPPKYVDRSDRSENPGQFFLRVYAPYVSFGLMPPDVRKADKDYYNAFHVWCTRNERTMHSYFLRARRLKER